MKKMSEMKIKPIGYIKKSEVECYLEILPEYDTGLFNLNLISHVFVLWWIHEADLKEFRKTKNNVCPRVVDPLYPPEKMGTFATRSPHRPNPIGMTLVKIKSIKRNKVYVDHIDAFPNTAIIDIKPYIPNSDRVDKIQLPKWFLHLKESRLVDRSTESSEARSG